MGQPVDALHRIMKSLDHFENKLDKLQDDVNFHGQTLTELRLLVKNLSGPTIIAADVPKGGEIKRLLNKNASNQYSGYVFVDDAKLKKKNTVPLPTKTKRSIQPLPSKTKQKSSSQTQKSMSPQISPIKVHDKKFEIGTKGISQKHAQRHRKADAQRKANMLKTQKIVANKLRAAK